jgi:hypothetical protein
MALASILFLAATAAAAALGLLVGPLGFAALPLAFMAVVTGAIGFWIDRKRESGRRRRQFAHLSALFLGGFFGLVGGLTGVLSLL